MYAGFLLYLNCWTLNVASDFAFVVFVYLLTGYIKRFPDNYITRHLYRIPIAMYITIICLQVITAAMGKNIIGVYFTRRYSVFIVVMTSCIFNIFKKMSFKQHNVINKMAMTTLGVYMMHENALYKLWMHKVVFQFENYINSWTFVPYVNGCALVSIIVMIVIDLLRIYLIELPFEKVSNKVLGGYFYIVNSWISI